MSTLDDARRLIANRAADLFNIRLAKCGGFRASKRIVDVARAAGLGCHLGTLVGETGILSRAAEIFGSRTEGFECLDGKGQSTFLLAEDVVDPPDWVGGAASAHEPGLGINVRRSRVARLVTGEPVVFQGLVGAPS